MKRTIVLAVVAAAFGLTACTSGGTTDAQQPPASTTSTPSVPPPTSVVTEQVTETVTKPALPPAKPVLDGSGYGQLKMGMPRQQALATGLIGPNEDPNAGTGTCTVHKLKGADLIVHISSRFGVSTINFTKEMAATGVGAGSKVSEIAKAYPEAKFHEGVGTYGPAGPNTKFVFRHTDVDIVSSQLNLNRQDCHS